MLGVATNSHSGYCLRVIFIISHVVLVLYYWENQKMFGLLYGEYLFLPSLSDSIISLNFIICIPKDLLDVASSRNYTYGSIRVAYLLVVDYLYDTIG